MATYNQLNKKLYNDRFTIKKVHKLQFSLEINSHSLEITTKVTHVGIPVVSDMKSDPAIEMAIRKSRAAFHSSLGFSFKDQISLNPLTSLKLYKSVILPTFLYGSEVWNNMSTSIH